MIKVYELSKVPQFGEVLTCKCFKDGDAIPSVLIHAKFTNQPDPVQVIFERVPEVAFSVCFLQLKEFYSFIDSPHWRDSVAKQWKRYGDLFDDDVINEVSSSAND